MLWAWHLVKFSFRRTFFTACYLPQFEATVLGNIFLSPNCRREMQEVPHDWPLCLHWNRSHQIFQICTYFHFFKWQLPFLALYFSSLDQIIPWKLKVYTVFLKSSHGYKKKNVKCLSIKIILRSYKEKHRKNSTRYHKNYTEILWQKLL